MSSAVTVAAPKSLSSADNIINTLDNNFLEVRFSSRSPSFCSFFAKQKQEFGKLQLTSGPRDPLDHVGAREWLEKVYRPLPKTPKPIHCVRKPTAIRIHDVIVSYGNQEKFNLRVYQPQISSHEESTRSLPAVLAYHGGGWIHGYSELEDGEIVPSVSPADADF